MTTTKLVNNAKREAINRMVAMGAAKKYATKIVNDLYKEQLETAGFLDSITASLKSGKMSEKRALNVIANAIYSSSIKEYRSEWREEAKPIRAHMRDLRKRGYEFDMARVDRLTIRELKYYAKNPIEFNKRFGTPPSDTIPDIVTKTKTLSRRESWEKYKRDIAAYNKMAEKYHASKFAEFKRDEEGDYFVSDWSKYSQRPRRALRNLPEKNQRMFTNFVKVYDAMGAAGNEEAAYIARMLRQFYLNDEVAFIQILNDAAKGKNALEYIHMFASTTQEKDNALQSFTEIYDVFGKDKYGELAIKPYNSRTIED